MGLIKDALALVRQTNGETAASKSVLMAGKDGSGNGIPLKVDADGVLDVNATATATFEDRHENLITVECNYRGKVAGQTYDVPHVFKTTGSASFSSPSAFGGGEGTYTGLVALDGGIRTDATSGNGQRAQHLFTFDFLAAAQRARGARSGWTVSDLESNIKSILIRWYGYGTAPSNGATLKRWNADTTAWVSAGSHTATSVQLIEERITSGLGALIDANGQFHLLAHTTTASDGVTASAIYTDFVEVLFELAADVLNTPDPGDQHEVLIYRDTTFAGKTAGDVRNVPHVAKYGGAAPAAFAAPSAWLTEVNQTAYNNIASQDGTNANYNTSTNTASMGIMITLDILTTARRTPGIPHNITVPELRRRLRVITPNIYCYGTGPTTGGATVKVWNWTGTPAWDAFGTTASTTAPASVTANVTNFGAYIDNGGFMYLLVYSTDASDGVTPSNIYVDFNKVTFGIMASFLHDQSPDYAQEQILNSATVTAGATTAVASNLDISRCSDVVVAINPSATHTWSAAFAWVGADNVEQVASGDRVALIASASQGKKISAKTAVLFPRGTIYVTNGDASDRTYYPRIERLGMRADRASA